MGGRRTPQLLLITWSLKVVREQTHFFLSKSKEPNLEERPPADLEKMEDTQQFRRRWHGPEVEEVQSRIVRATGRKDRHSKVLTAKGVRDRRVRLSAHTAVQFYDVQDRLGFDRPSKAVNWLIENAKPAIDRLAQLAPQHFNHKPPSAAASARGDNSDEKSVNAVQDLIYHHQQIPMAPGHQALFNCSAPLAFDSISGDGDGGYLYGTPAQLLQSQFLAQRGTLQSSYPPSVHAWADPALLPAASDQHLTAVRRSSSSTVLTAGNSAGAGVGFSGFHTPARIQEREEHGGAVANETLAASSTSCHSWKAMVEGS